MVDFQQPAFTPSAGTALEGVAGQIAGHVVQLIRDANRNADRSLQRAIGPSEIGTPCVARLARKLLDWPEVNADTDGWCSQIGTAVHAYMAEVFEKQNAALGRERYLVEQRVRMSPTLAGSSDLFDRDGGIVIDWKVVGLDRLAAYRRKGPGDQYRTQGHTYGLGFQLAGEQVNHVAIVFLPRGGRTDELHVWTEPYDYRVPVAALNRIDQVKDLLLAIDPEQTPAHWKLLPTADAFCSYCPYFLPKSADLSVGCPGHAALEAARKKRELAA